MKWLTNGGVHSWEVPIEGTNGLKRLWQNTLQPASRAWVAGSTTGEQGDVVVESLAFDRIAQTLEAADNLIDAVASFGVRGFELRKELIGGLTKCLKLVAGGLTHTKVVAA